MLKDFADHTTAGKTNLTGIYYGFETPDGTPQYISVHGLEFNKDGTVSGEIVGMEFQEWERYSKTGQLKYFTGRLGNQTLDLNMQDGSYPHTGLVEKVYGHTPKEASANRYQEDVKNNAEQLQGSLRFLGGWSLLGGWTGVIESGSIGGAAVMSYGTRTYITGKDEVGDAGVWLTSKVLGEGAHSEVIGRVGSWVLMGRGAEKIDQGINHLVLKYGKLPVTLPAGYGTTIYDNGDIYTNGFFDGKVGGMSATNSSTNLPAVSTGVTGQTAVGYNGGNQSTALTNAVSSVGKNNQAAIGWNPKDGYTLLRDGNIQGPKGGIYQTQIAPNDKIVYRNNSSYYEFVNGEKVKISSPFSNGGRLGSAETRAGLDTIRDAFKDAGGIHLYGAGKPEEYLSGGVKGSTLNSNYIDFSGNWNGNDIRINTVTVNNGKITTGELIAAQSINAKLPSKSEPIFLIPKGQEVDGIQKIIDELTKKYGK